MQNRIGNRNIIRPTGKIEEFIKTKIVPGITMRIAKDKDIQKRQLPATDRILTVSVDISIFGKTELNKQIHRICYISHLGPIFSISMSTLINI